MHPKWIGTRTSAVIALLGSGLTLVIAATTLFSAFFAPPPPETNMSPIPIKGLLIGTAAMFIALATWGISTAIAIFLRRPWSRISILIFAGLLTIISAFAMLIIPFVQVPATPGATEAAPDRTTMIRVIMAALYGVLTAIGIWWLSLFNRSRTKEYFGGQEPAAEGSRPLSISVIAWYLLITSLFILPAALLRFPTVLLGVVITGWTTVAIYAAFGVVQVLLGRGLLRLQDGARRGTIAFFSFTLVNGLVSVIRPGYPEIIRQMQIAMPRFFPAGAPAMLGPTWLFPAIGLAFVSVPVFFLMRHRSHFRPLAPIS